MQIPDREFEKLVSETEKFQTKHTDLMAELKSRLLDIEQGRAYKPGSIGGGGGSGAKAIIDAMTADPQFKALQQGALSKARFSIPPESLQLKTITTTITGGTIYQPDRGPEIIAPAERRLTVRALMRSIPTNVGATEYVQEVAFTNSAGPQGGPTSPQGTGEGELKNESDISFQLKSSPIATIAHFFTVSRQALDDLPALQAHIEGRGFYGLALEEESELLTGDGGAGKLSGLISNATSFTGGATNQALADTIRKAVTQIAKSEHVATAVILNPTELETLDIAKDSQGRYLSIVVMVNGVPTVWRLQIVATNSMTAGNFLC